jgi:hypothetical protein
LRRPPKRHISAMSCRHGGNFFVIGTHDHARNTRACQRMSNGPRDKRLAGYRQDIFARNTFRTSPSRN